MDRLSHQLFGGGLRPNDPRRFLVEAMLGAINAGGDASVEALAFLEGKLADHRLFAELSTDQIRTLVSIARDAFGFSTGPSARIAAIARGLPTRIERLAAYVTACEVCVADGSVLSAELEFLDDLRRAVRLGSEDAHVVFQATREGLAERLLEEGILAIRKFIPVVADLFAARAAARGILDDRQRIAARDYFASIADLAEPMPRLDDILVAAFSRPRPPGQGIYQELVSIAARAAASDERHWLMVYALAAEPAEATADLRMTPFIGMLQRALDLGADDLEGAVVDARSFPAARPRP